MFRLFVAILALSAACFAQAQTPCALNPSKTPDKSETKCGIAGVLTDPSGAVIPGAKVAMVAGNDRFEVVTDEEGRFCFAKASNQWILTASKSQFHVKTIDSATLKGRTDLKNLVVTLSPKEGMIICVDCEGDNVLTIDVTSSAVQRNITDWEFEKIPHSRSVTDLF